MIPQLRFPEFSDEWHLKILGDIGSTYPGLSGKSGDDFGHGSPYVTYTQIFKSTTVDDNFGYVKINPGEKQNAVEAGDIFFTGSSESPQETGYVSVILKSVDNLYLNSFCFGYRADKNELVPAFARYVLHSPGTRNAIVRLAQGSTRYNISKKSVMNLGISLPSKLEQEKVADFMTAVDERIDLGEKKLEQLQLYKRGVMQKIFSQQIRFKDEKGKEHPEWEEMRLGKAFQERTERGGDLKSMLSIKINGGIVPFSTVVRKDNSSLDKSNYKQVKRGDIAYNSMRMWQGASGVSELEGIVSPAYTVIKPNTGNVSKFWGYYFKLPSVVFTFQRYSQGLTSDTWNLKYNQLSEITLPVPCFDEQQKIADFLTALDKKIFSEQTKLASARQFKTALLQRLFV